MRALEKDPDRRYSSASEFGDDIQRHLEDEPVAASPPSTAYRLRKLVRKNKGPLAAVGAVMLTLAVGLVISTLLYFQAERASARARRESYTTNIRAAQASLLEGNSTEARRLLQLCDPALRRWEWHYLWLRSDSSLSVMQTDGAGVVSVGFSPDGARLLAHTPSTAYAWDSETTQLMSSHGVATIVGTSGESELSIMAIDREGRRVLVGEGQDPSIDFFRFVEREVLSPFRDDDDSPLDDMEKTKRVFRIHHLTPGTEPVPLQGVLDNLLAAEFSSDGTKIAALSTRNLGSSDVFDIFGSRAVQVWDASSGRMLTTVDGVDGLTAAMIPGCRPWAFVENDQIVVATGEQVRLVEIESGDETVLGEGVEDQSCSVAVSPDGKRIIVDDLGRAHEYVAPSPVRRLFGARRRAGSTLRLRDPIGSFPRFWRDRIVSAVGSTIQVTDRRAQQQGVALLGHPDRVTALTVRAPYALSGSLDGTVRLWNLDTGAVSGLQIGSPSRPFAFVPEGRQILAPEGRQLRLIFLGEPHRNRSLTGQEGTIVAVGAGADGQTAVTAGYRTIRLWDLRTGEPSLTIPAPEEGVVEVRFGPVAGQIAAVSEDGSIHIWDAVTGERSGAIEGLGKTVTRFAFDPPATKVATSTADGSIRIRDVESGETIVRIAAPRAPLALAFDAEGRRLAGGAADGLVRVWDADTGKLNGIFHGHSGFVNGVGFSPDGMRLVSASLEVQSLDEFSSTIHVWDTRSGENLLTLSADGVVITIGFAPDGRELVALTEEGYLTAWTRGDGEAVK
jgi:WD40 repeat protein